MSPLLPESHLFADQIVSQTETSKLSKEEIEEIISQCRERLPSLPEIIQKTLEAALGKIEKALKYTDPRTKKNALENGLHFLTVLGVYLSSPSYRTSPPQTMEELINGLNSFCPDPLFLKPGDTFTAYDHLGNNRTYKITQITPPGELPSDLRKRGYISGTNMWDSPEGKRFIPGNYWMQKLM